MTGYLAEHFGGMVLPLQVLKSAAGWYIGTWGDGPFSRESVEYYATEDEAQDAVDSGTWTQRRHP
jgi:hypothetical protein